MTLIVGAQMTGCSGSGDTESGNEKSVTRKAADEAAKGMRTPLEKARAVKQQEEDRLGKMQKNLKE